MKPPIQARLATDELVEDRFSRRYAAAFGATESPTWPKRVIDDAVGGGTLSCHLTRPFRAVTAAVDRLALEGEDGKDAFVNAVERLTADEALERFDAEL